MKAHNLIRFPLARHLQGFKLNQECLIGVCNRKLIGVTVT